MEDPIFTAYSPLRRNEKLSTSKKILKVPIIIQRRKNRRPQKKEMNTVDVPKEEPLKQEMSVDPVTPVDPLTVNCTVTRTGHVQQPMSPAGSGTRPSPLLNPNNYLFPPTPPFMNGTSQLPFMQQVFNINALLLAANLQRMSGQFSSSACEKCRIRLDPNCQCARTLPQGLGGPFPGFPPFLPFLPQPALLDQFRMGMPSVLPLWHPPPQGMYQTPSTSSTCSTPSYRVQTVLNDHCYLNKAQMQKLSPQSNASSAPVSPIHSPKQNKVKQTKSSCNEKLNLRSKVLESPKSSLKQSRTYTSSVRFSLESLSSSEEDEKDCLRLNLSDPGIKRENSDSPLDKEDLSDDKSKIAVIANDNLTLGRSVSEQILNNKTEGEEREVPSRKRKIVRSTSVPGWFGKGLNLKKKRRF